MERIWFCCVSFHFCLMERIEGTNFEIFLFVVFKLNEFVKLKERYFLFFPLFLELNDELFSFCLLIFEIFLRMNFWILFIWNCRKALEL